MEYDGPSFADAKYFLKEWPDEDEFVEAYCSQDLTNSEELEKEARSTWREMKTIIENR